MIAEWPTVALGDVLAKSDNWIDIKPVERYRQVTVRLWGKGVVQRGEVSGAEIAAGRQLAVHAGQFILSRIDARNGAFGLVPRSLEGAVVSNDFPTFVVNTQRVLPSYLDWLSKTHNFVDLCKAASEGTTNRVRLKEDRFLATAINLPPLDEQRRIVARIEELAAKIEEARGLRRQAGEEAKLLTTASARQLLAQVDTPTTELRHWLNQERDGIQTGPFGAQLSSSDFTDSGTPILTISNVQFNGLKLDNLRHVTPEKASQLARYKLKKGDILFARMGTIGRCCLVPEEAEGWLINYHIIRVALSTDVVEPRYMFWVLRASTDVETYLAEKIRGATREGVNSAIVGGLPCRVPDLEEQRRIVSYLDGLETKLDALKLMQTETAAELDALLPSVLDKAFSGEL